MVIYQFLDKIKQQVMASTSASVLVLVWIIMSIVLTLLRAASWAASRRILVCNVIAVTMVHAVLWVGVLASIVIIFAIVHAVSRLGVLICIIVVVALVHTVPRIKILRIFNDSQGGIQVCFDISHKFCTSSVAEMNTVTVVLRVSTLYP